MFSIPILGQIYALQILPFHFLDSELEEQKFFNSVDNQFLSILLFYSVCFVVS